MSPNQPRMRNVIYLANFLIAFGSTLTLFTNSTFIEQTVGVERVGIVYALAALTAIFLLVRIGRILPKIGNQALFMRYATAYVIALAGIIIPSTDVIRTIALGAYLCIGSIIVFTINIFFAHLSPTRGKGRARAKFLLLGNLGILFGPFVASRAIEFGGFTTTYALALCMFLVVTVLLYIGLRGFQDADYAPPRIMSAMRHSIRVPMLRNVLAANFILQFFYAWMVVYTPIYLSQYLGFSWGSIGLIFSVMLTPFVMLDYPLGRLADWIGSEKELAAIGFVIMSASVFGIALGGYTSVLAIGALLFASRIGAATVEVMTEIHFFKIAKDTDPSTLSLFADIRPLSYAFAPLLGALCMAFLPFRMIFVVLGFILFVGCYVASQMERNHQWWARAHKT